MTYYMIPNDGFDIFGKEVGMDFETLLLYYEGQVVGYLEKKED